MLLCFLGDFFIGLSEEPEKPAFYAGADLFWRPIWDFPFLLMLHPGIDPFNIGIPLAVGVVFLLVERLCGLKMRKLRWPAFFYALLLAFFHGQCPGICPGSAVGRSPVDRSGSGAVFRLGCEHYFLYFHTFRRPEQKTAVHVFNLATYYLGILGILIGLGTL